MCEPAARIVYAAFFVDFQAGGAAFRHLTKIVLRVKIVVNNYKNFVNSYEMEHAWTFKRTVKMGLRIVL